MLEIRRDLTVSRTPALYWHTGMDFPRFDPSHVVKFDLSRGQVEVEGGAPRVLLPADGLIELCKSAGEEAVKSFGRRLGTEAGRRTADALGSGLGGASLEALLEHLGGNLAMMGFGSLGLERWGKALVFTIDASPFGAHGDALVAAVIEGALQRAAGRDVEAVVLARDDERVRLVVLNASAARSVRGWLGDGQSWGEVLSRLHRSSARGDA
jgi:hypothetical protein